MEDKIILKFKTKNILNFYEIEPWSILCTELSGITPNADAFSGVLRLRV